MSITTRVERPLPRVNVAVMRSVLLAGHHLVIAEIHATARDWTVHVHGVAGAFDPVPQGPNHPGIM
jgi:hypothetical protein